MAPVTPTPAAPQEQAERKGSGSNKTPKEEPKASAGNTQQQASGNQTPREERKSSGSNKQLQQERKGSGTTKGNTKTLQEIMNANNDASPRQPKRQDNATTVKYDPMSFRDQIGREELENSKDKKGCLESVRSLRNEREAYRHQLNGQKNVASVWGAGLRGNTFNRGALREQLANEDAQFSLAVDDPQQLKKQRARSQEPSQRELFRGAGYVREKDKGKIRFDIYRTEDSEFLFEIFISPHASVRELHALIVRMLGGDSSNTRDENDAEFMPLRLMHNKVNIFINDRTVWEAGLSHKAVVHVARARRRFVLLTCGSYGAVKLWSGRSGRCVQTFQHPDCVNSASISQDATLVATACIDGTARVWNSETGDKVASLKGHVLGVNYAAIAPSNAVVATASEDGTAMLWMLSSRKVLHVLGGHGDAVTCVSFSPDGSRVATASRDRVAIIWSTESGRCLLKLVGHDDIVVSVGFSPDASSVITGSADRTARIWSSKSGGCRQVLGGHGSFLCQADFTADGSMAITATYSGTVRIWSVGSNECLRVWRMGCDIKGAWMHKQKITCICEEADRPSRASTGFILRVHSPDDDEPPMTLSGHRGSVTFAKMVAVG